MGKTIPPGSRIESSTFFTYAVSVADGHGGFEPQTGQRAMFTGNVYTVSEYGRPSRGFVIRGRDIASIQYKLVIAWVISSNFLINGEF